MKNICLFGGDFRVGGASVVAVKLANELSRDYNVHFVATHDNENTLYGKENILPNVTYHNFALNKERILKMHSKVRPLMKKYIKENNIDVVLAIGYYPAFYMAPIIRYGGKCKFVYCEHESPASMLSDKKATLMRRVCAKTFDMTVALTKRSERDFVNIFKANSKKVTTIYNWMDESLIEENAVYDINCKKILTVGRISEEKGFDMLAEIAKHLFVKCPDWEWHIMGDGPDREKFEAKIKEYGIEKNIVMHGMVANASEKFGDYSVMALTSYREGLPLTLLEAKAKKLPCISFDVVTGPAEIIRDGVNGYLIPTYDCELFAQKLAELACNDELRLQFSDNALLDVDKFQKKKILSEWLELISDLTK